MLKFDDEQDEPTDDEKKIGDGVGGGTEDQGE